MNDRRRGLGRGLGALIPTAPPEEQHAPAAGRLRGDVRRLLLDGNAARRLRRAADGAARTDGRGCLGRRRRLATVAGAYFAELPITAITPNARQPRQVFEEEAMAELVHSIKEVGLLQPVVVRRTGADTLRADHG